MQCVILAGGLATRLRPRTDRIPKTILPVAGSPFAHHQLQWLAGQGVSRVVYCIGHLGGMIRDFVGDGRQWALSVQYSDEGDRLRGTAGALRLALDEGLLEPGFLVLYGDSYLRTPIPPIWHASAAGTRALMTVFRNEGRWDESNARFDDGMVRLYEKGRADARELGMAYIDYGLSVLTRGIIQELVPPDTTMDLASVFHRLSIADRLFGFDVRDRFYEIGSLTGLRELDRHLRNEHQ